MDFKSILEHARTLLRPEPLDHIVDGRAYKVTPGPDGPEMGDIIAPPVASSLNLASLTGFVDAFNANIDNFASKKVAVHVVDHLTVTLTSLEADDFGRRHEWLRSTCREKNPFPFDTYQTPEMFLINLQSGFLPTEEVIQLQRLASSLTNESSVGVQDDGLSQTVTVKQGAVTRGQVDLPRRIALLPYRTFREVDPIQSEFLVRLKGSPGQLPQIALLELDAGGWKHSTALVMKRWLTGNLPATTVVIA
jgi:hypothetical protein